MMRKSLVILMLSLFPLLGMAERIVHVSGAVYDAGHKPLEQVDVVVNGSMVGTATDSLGHYSLAWQPMGTDTVSLSFSMLGFGEEKKLLRIDTLKSSYEVNVVMRDSVTLLQGISVVDRARQTSATVNLPVEKIKEIPNVNGSIETLLQTQAGVTSNNELSSQYSVRGGNYDENCVYVNHIEIYRPLLVRSGEQEGLSFVNPDMVQSLSFSSGGFSAEYGDKMSSVLDIQYKQPKAFEGSASVSLLGASVYVGAKTGPVSQMHSVRYKSSEYLLGSMDTKGEYTPRFFDYQTYLTWNLAPKWDLSFLGYVSRNSYQFQPESRSTNFGTMTSAKNFTVYFDGQEEDLFQTYFGNLSLKFTPCKNLELQLLSSSYYTQEHETYDISGEYWLSDVDGSSTLSVDYGMGIGTYHQHARNRLNATVSNLSQIGRYVLSNNELKWGLTYQREHVSEHTNEWELRDSAGYSIPSGQDAYALYYNLFSHNVLSANRLLAYLQDSYNFYPTVGRVMLTAGLRGNYWDYNQELIVSPRASVAFFPSALPKWGFRLASGMYSQSPFYKELRDTTIAANGNATVTMNKDIKAQRSFQVVGAADYYFRMWQRPFKFTAEAYGKYIDRLISYSVDNVKVVYSGKNDGTGYVLGGDVKIFGEFVPGTDSWISLSVMQAKENIDGDGAGYLSRPTDQRYNISMFFQDYFPGYKKFKVNMKLVWADGLPFGPPRSERKDAIFRSKAYRRVDIGASYVLKREDEKFMQRTVLRHLHTITIGLDVLNLFDISNVNSYYWVTDVTNVQYAVPNYLTGRQLNARISVDF